MFYRHAKIEPSSRNGDASSGLLFIYNLITGHKLQIKKEKCTRLGVIKGGFDASSLNEKFSTSVQQTCSLIVNFHRLIFSALLLNVVVQNQHDFILTTNFYIPFT